MELVAATLALVVLIAFFIGWLRIVPRRSGHRDTATEAWKERCELDREALRTSHAMRRIVSSAKRGRL